MTEAYRARIMRLQRDLALVTLKTRIQTAASLQRIANDQERRVQQANEMTHEWHRNNKKGDPEPPPKKYPWAAPDKHGFAYTQNSTPDDTIQCGPHYVLYEVYVSPYPKAGISPFYWPATQSMDRARYAETQYMLGHYDKLTPVELRHFRFCDEMDRESRKLQLAFVGIIAVPVAASAVAFSGLGAATMQGVRAAMPYLGQGARWGWQFFLSRVKDPSAWATAGADYSIQRSMGNTNEEVNFTSVGLSFLIPGGSTVKSQLLAAGTQALGASAFEASLTRGFGNTIFKGKDLSRITLESSAGTVSNFIGAKMGGGLGQGLSETVTRPFAKFGADAFGNFTGGYLFLGVGMLPFKAYDLNHDNNP